MSDGWIGYRPERIAGLRGRVRAALDDLRDLRSADPVAAGALRDVGLARRHLELDWLPLLDRIHASTAMTAPIHAMSSMRPMSHGDDSGPPSSLDAAAERNAAAAGAARPSESDEIVLSNGWSWSCGPVSASTGEAASGCEFMPPTRWDLVTPLVLAASVLPFTGEAIDAYDCAMGDIPCEAILVPGFSGRIGKALDELLGRAVVASRPARTVDDILMPNGRPVGQPGTSIDIREVTGDLAAAEATFIELSRGGELVFARENHVLIRLPGDDYVGLRTNMSESSRNTTATIDVNIDGALIRKIKYNP